MRRRTHTRSACRHGQSYRRDSMENVFSLCLPGTSCSRVRGGAPGYLPAGRSRAPWEELRGSSLHARDDCASPRRRPEICQRTHRHRTRARVRRIRLRRSRGLPAPRGASVAARSAFLGRLLAPRASQGPPTTVLRVHRSETLLELAVVTSLEPAPSVTAISPTSASPPAPLQPMEMPTQMFCSGRSRTKSAPRWLTLTAVFANIYRRCFSQVPHPTTRGKLFTALSSVESF